MINKVPALKFKFCARLNWETLRQKALLLTVSE